MEFDGDDDNLFSIDRGEVVEAVDESSEGSSISQRVPKFVISAAASVPLGTVVRDQASTRPMKRFDATAV